MRIVNLLTETPFVKRLLGLSLLCFSLLLWMRLPLMRAPIVNGETATVTVRGWNLPEFSLWGCIAAVLPLMAVVLVSVGRFRVRKAAALCAVFAAHVVCCVAGMLAAHAWFLSIGVSAVRWCAGTAALYPSGLLVAAALSLFFKNQKAETK